MAELGLVDTGGHNTQLEYCNGRSACARWCISVVRRVETDPEGQGTGKLLDGATGRESEASLRSRLDARHTQTETPSPARRSAVT